MKLLRAMMRLQEEHGAVTDEALRDLSRQARVPLYRLEGLRGFYPVFRSHPGPRTQVQVCRDVACRMAGGPGFAVALRTALDDAPDIEVEEASCLGRCETAPAATINHAPCAGSVAEIAAVARSGHVPAGPAAPGAAPRRWPTDPYAGPQEHYGTLRQVLSEGEAGRARIPDTLTAAGLQGMGGAGFPTGTKWALARDASGEPKTVICNADESEPGTFKDRVILAELPQLLIEGMVLAGWVIGAAHGIVYLRHEYAPERARLEEALAAARAAGALGKSVLGSGFAFDIEVFTSPGGYILGEETALLEALEDKRGEPRNKPPFPTTHGLNGRPTLMNNVETLAAVPAILARGADWWAHQGVGESRGLKFFAVSGDVVRPGVYCVPMGTPVGDLLALAGGVAEGKALAAFAPGGASSRFLPPHRLAVPLDFRPLQEAGSMLGSGAVLFVAEGRNLLDLAAGQARFFRNESCGKCVPCRVGTHKAVLLLEEALAGRPTEGLPPLLRGLAHTLARTSICGLGQVALDPVLSILDHFPAAARALLPDPPGEGP